MAQKTDTDLTNQAAIIGAEVIAGANSATRIGAMLKDIIDSKKNIASTALPYKMYSVRLSQSNTLAPFAASVFLDNLKSIGLPDTDPLYISIFITRNSAGNYNLSMVSGTLISLSSIYISLSDAKAKFGTFSTGTQGSKSIIDIPFTTADQSGTLADGILNYTYLELRVAL